MPDPTTTPAPRTSMTTMRTTMTEYSAADAHPLDASELDAVHSIVERRSEEGSGVPPQLVQRLLDTLDAERAGWFGALLAKYMRLVYEEDGSTFLYRLADKFDEAELAELRAIECHILEESDDD